MVLFFLFLYFRSSAFCSPDKKPICFELLPCPDNTAQERQKWQHFGHEGIPWELSWKNFHRESPSFPQPSQAPPGCAPHMLGGIWGLCKEPLQIGAAQKLPTVAGSIASTAAPLWKTVVLTRLAAALGAYLSFILSNTENAINIANMLKSSPLYQKKSKSSNKKLCQKESNHRYVPMVM